MLLQYLATGNNPVVSIFAATIGTPDQVVSECLINFLLELHQILK